MGGSAAADFAGTLRRMHGRTGVESLPAHLATAHGISDAKLTRLDVGVFRVDQPGGAPTVVARMFSSERPRAAAEADLAVLRHLADVGFPAERPHGASPLSVHEGQAVLLTEFVKAAPKANQPPYPVVRMGTRIGRLHTLEVPPGGDRPAGALHHFAEGGPTDELAAAIGWIDSVATDVPAGGKGALDDLRGALAAADGGDGLPEALVHPDPVPKNAVFTAEGPVMVDWAGTGRGPRLASMTLLLRSSWAAAPFLKGYARSITLTDEERSRLAELLFARQLVNAVFRACHQPAKLPGVAKKLPALRRANAAHAGELLGSI